jgi:hypothetical protein
VSRAMTEAFRLIGYANIDDDHVSPPARIIAALDRELRSERRAAFPPLAPVPLALYQCGSWRKPG